MSDCCIPYSDIITHYAKQTGNLRDTRILVLLINNINFIHSMNLILLIAEGLCHLMMKFTVSATSSFLSCPNLCVT
jgi:hypothetical protein